MHSKSAFEKLRFDGVIYFGKMQQYRWKGVQPNKHKVLSTNKLYGVEFLMSLAYWFIMETQ